MWPFRRKGSRQPPQLADPPAWMVEVVRQRTGLPLDECRKILSCATIEEYRRITAVQSPAEYLTLDSDTPNQEEVVRQDPLEDNPAFATVLLRASLEAEREVGAFGDYGHCFVFWDYKKRILRKKYGVVWFDEAELNPGIDFD